MAGVKGRSGGHNAKTVSQHVLQGTYDVQRHAGYDNPDVPEGVPMPPKLLKGDALAEWDRMIERMRSMKTLSTVDGGALYQYCRLFAQTEAIADRQEQTGRLIERLEAAVISKVPGDGKLSGELLVAAIAEIGTLRQLQARDDTQIRQGRMAQRTYLVEFGLTPASRSRVKLISDPEPDLFDEFDAPRPH